MKGKTSILYPELGALVIILILTGLILWLLVGGYVLTTQSVVAQEPVGPQGQVGPQGPADPDVTSSVPQGRVGPDIASVEPDLASVGPQEAVGPQEHVGPEISSVGRGAGTEVVPSFDWVYLAACVLVLAAVGFGVAVGLGTRKQLLHR